MKIALILTAAGNSSRMGGPVKKEYLTIAENDSGRVSVLSSCLYAFLSLRLFSDIIITVPRSGETEARRILAEDLRLLPLVKEGGVSVQFAEGGMTRQDSVRAGLERLAPSADGNGLPGTGPDIVLIHDGARPWVKEKTIRDVIALAEERGAAVPGIPSVDTQKEIDSAGKILRHLDRSTIVSVQTPQGFRFGPLLEAHRKAAGDGHAYTDDTEIWGRYAGDAYACDGDRENKKITYRGDL